MQRPGLRWVCCCFLAAAARAFDTLNYQGQKLRRNNRPAIRYAIAPDFFHAIQPRLTAEGADILGGTKPYATQKRLAQLFRQVFDSYEANNENLHFIDVSDRCRTENLWMPVDELDCYSSPACTALEAGGPLQDDWLQGQTDIDNSTYCTFASCYECERADVVIGGFHPQNRDIADHVQARVVNRRISDVPPLLSNGNPTTGVSVLGAGGDAGSRRGRSATFIQFNLDVEYAVSINGNATLAPLCWRLDTGTCKWLADRRVDDPFRIIMIVFIVVLTLISLSILALCVQGCRMLAYNLLKGWDLNHDGKVDREEMVYVLDEFCGSICFECKCPTVHSRQLPCLFGWLGVCETIAKFSMLSAVIFLVVLVALPLTYFTHLMPCVNCLDLRAAAAHEIGHMLMLGNQDGQATLMRNFSYDSYDCLDPGALFVPGMSENATLMEAIGLTAANSESPAPMHCPTNDDLDGLNYLYPTCGGNEIRRAECSGYGGDFASWLRLVETWWHFSWPIMVSFLGLKIVVQAFLFIEHTWAARKLRQGAGEAFREEYNRHKERYGGNRAGSER